MNKCNNRYPRHDECDDEYSKHDKCEDEYPKHDKCEDKYPKHDKCEDEYPKHDKCDEKEKEIRNLLKFIFAELDNMECDMEKIQKALKRLFYLLDDDCKCGNKCDNKKEDIKCVIEDVKALNYFINKTKKDLKCLAQKTL